MKGYTKLLICFAFIGTTMAYTNPELLFGDETSTTLNNDGTMDPGDINTFDEDHGHTPKLKGKHIVNEDMMLTDAEERLYFGSNKQNDEADDEEDAKLYDAITDKRYRWDPSKPIPYVISSKLGTKAKKAITDAMARYRENTCVNFREKQSSDKDYIFFDKRDGCWSQVGMQDGMQAISIGKGCEYEVTVIHEIMHALGFFHEQARPDRDSYVKILFDNVKEGRKSQFQKLNSAETYGEGYDFRSIMHYKKNAFSKNGNPTIKVLGLFGFFKTLGQSTSSGHFSKTDVKQIKKMFNCGSKVTSNTRRRRWFGKK